ncbi:MAG: ABC transporter ATP-binding protein [Pseudomonadota bacterium]
MSHPLLEVEDLRVTFDTPKGPVEAVRGVGFSVDRGERVGVVGESGSGKSQTGRAIIGVTDRRATVTARRLAFDGQDLMKMRRRERARLRGARMSMILQDPKYSLNPVMKVGRQIAETVMFHQRLSRRAADARAVEMLSQVHIRDAERVYHAYPHELSGGMGQRVMIAMMMAPEPELVIADEPTSALDVTVSIQVLGILDELVTRRGAGLMFISHDLDLVSSFCDRVVIMYAGRIVETCAAKDLAHATHPYTQGLLNCLPKIDQPGGELAVLRRDPAWAEEASA